MSEKIKAKIGEELYNQILAKGLKETEFDLLDSYIPKSRFNEVNEKVKLLDEKIKSYDSQINETKNMLKGSEELKTQYSELQKKYKMDLEAKDKEVNNILKKSKFKETLVQEGAKHPDLLMKEVNWDNINLEGDNLIGGSDVIKGIKETYSDLFTTKTTEGNVPTKTDTKTTTNNTGSIFDNFR